MIYLSIDVGIKNLGYIIYDTNLSQIIRWDIITLCETNASKVDMITLGKTMNDTFNETFSSYSIDKVIIENQIGFNAIRMKSVQSMITMYFIHKGILDICYWNASNKLKDYDLPKKTTYAQRKKESINITKTQITNTYPDNLDYFMSHKKKDDLADAYLQLVSYIK
tara:strand:+ start:153 stop:650 length:498 start_codon:yes stop_codon:yes gene_type:complete